MEIDKIADRTVGEIIELMATEEFENKVHKDATIAFVFEYSRILLTNYHNELASKLKANGIEI